MKCVAWRINIIKCTQMDLNHRPSAYQTDVLTRLNYEYIKAMAQYAERSAPTLEASHGTGS